MSKLWKNTIISFAIFFAALGFVIAFVNLEQYCIVEKNDGYVGAFFALAGVLLYFAALMYQIKEYKLQVEELKKSVEAQTKSSTELEGQRRILEKQKTILIEQNGNNLIFKNIDYFNEFKQRNKTQECIEEFIKSYCDIYSNKWNKLVAKEVFNYDELVILIQLDLKSYLELYQHSPILRKYVQTAYNILYLIDEHNNTFNERNNYLKSLFYNQQNGYETSLIYLFNLIPVGWGIYENLSWSNYETIEILNVISNNSDFNKKALDTKKLTTAFIKVKQGNNKKI